MSESLVTTVVALVGLIQGGQFLLILRLLTIAMDNRARLSAIEAKLDGHPTLRK